ncbi:dual-specificity rna methyltransferase rlmn [Quercus suber]|uniref:Dual-specificity rna methyltransferase rlmn n=1 Tax=Quercus suber TaxID=58331 RepID=A0AAW0M2L9_QUESU
MGSMWMMRQVSIRVVASTNSLLLSNSIITSQFPISFSFYPKSQYLISLVSSSHRHSLSTTTASSSSSHFGDVEEIGVSKNGSNSKTLLKGPGQALMLWKRLYGNDIWAHQIDELEDGQVIETVVIPCDRGRTTVCVSSQVGCAMNCQFCYTGRQAFILPLGAMLLTLFLFLNLYLYCRMGLKRHLTAAEIVEQAVFARRLLTSEVGSITNVVFMGMGEPLHNIDNVIKAADIMVHDQGLHFSPRKVTVSTSGLVPQLRRFLHESNCALAVSLNATTDEVRNWIMPINRKYKLGLLLETLREELRFKNNYKVLFEYVMLSGVNDSIEDAKRLIDLIEGIPCKINLISFNPHTGSQFQPTSDAKMIEFRNVLAEAGCTVFLRPSRGDDQMAACGQLGNPGAIQAPLLRVPKQFQTALNISVRNWIMPINRKYRLGLLLERNFASNITTKFYLNIYRAMLLHGFTSFIIKIIVAHLHYF